jgi:hypothetical protein
MISGTQSRGTPTCLPLGKSLCNAPMEWWVRKNDKGWKRGVQQFDLPACRQVGLSEKTCKATCQLAGKSTCPNFETPYYIYAWAMGHDVAHSTFVTSDGEKFFQSGTTSMQHDCRGWKFPRGKTIFYFPLIIISANTSYSVGFLLFTHVSVLYCVFVWDSSPIEKLKFLCWFKLISWMECTKKCWYFVNLLNEMSCSP